jgi:uncharacterized protein
MPGARIASALGGRHDQYRPEQLQCKVKATRFARSRFNAVCGMLMPPRTSADKMKLHSSSTQQYQTVTGYDASGVEINAQRFNYSLMVMPEAAPQPWDVASFEQLTAQHFERIAAQEPDVVILGTGERQRFVHPRLIASLSARHTGVECMDSHAACRTYNILMGEGRKVTLALIIEGAKAGQ